MMTEKGVRRFIKELEEIHKPALDAPPASKIDQALQQIEARSKLSVLYAVVEEAMPDYPCTRFPR